jgi:ribosomal protein S12 methylthiotransferase accessory factor
MPATQKTSSAWPVEVFAPFPQSSRVVFGRAAARSAMFGRTSASGGASVLIGSAAGHNRHEVAVRARGELLERLSNVLAGRAAEAAYRVVATFGQLRLQRVPAVDPIHWGGPETREAVQLWVTGRSLLTGAEALVPAGATFLQHRPPQGCQAVVRVGSTGVAAHPDPAAAANHAVWEILERDLVRRSWYDPRSAPAVVSGQPSLPAALEQLLRHLGLRLTVLCIPSPATVGCVVACLSTENGDRQSFGARCGSAGDQRLSVEKAAYEALMVRWSMSTAVALKIWEQWAGNNLPRTAVEHALWALHRQDSLRLWLDRPNTAGTLSTSRTAPWPPTAAWRPPAQLLSKLTGEDVIAVDTTTTQARAEGLAVIRLVAPRTYPLPTGRDNNPDDPPHPFG